MPPLAFTHTSNKASTLKLIPLSTHWNARILIRKIIKLIMQDYCFLLAGRYFHQFVALLTPFQFTFISPTPPFLILISLCYCGGAHYFPPSLLFHPILIFTPRSFCPFVLAKSSFFSRSASFFLKKFQRLSVYLNTSTDKNQDK